MVDIVNVTQEQLQEVVKSAQRMREVLRSHLGMLEARLKRASEEGKQIPSEDNFFMYVADSHGLIRIQQDAAFDVEAVLVAHAVRSSTTSQSTLFQAAFELSLVDANSGRDLTGGFHVATQPTPSTVGPTLNDVEESAFIDHLQLVPVAGAINDMFIPNVDDWKTQKAEHLLPRGSVVQARFNGYTLFGGGPPFGQPQDFTNPDVVLMGYKIF